MSELTVAAQCACQVPAQAGGSRCGVAVLQGRMVAGPVDRVSELAGGDYASFPTEVPRVYEAVRGVARAVLLSAGPGG